MQSQTTDPDIIEQEKQLIRELANLTGKDEVVFNDTGWDSRVYSINNGRYFFKFPRSDKAKKRYANEIAALKLAAAINSPIIIPKVVWEHPANNYFGYEGVQGTPLEEIITTLDQATKQNIGEVYGAFLKQFHELELPGVSNITVEREIKQLHKWYKPAVPVIQKAFSEKDQKRLQNLVNKVWPKQLLALGSEPRLCHGDLGYWNILYGSDGRLGIIDLGDVGYYDRSKDFIGLEDRNVFEAALKAYGDSKKLRQKIAVREPIMHIITLTFYIVKQDEPGIQKTLPKLKAILS